MTRPLPRFPEPDTEPFWQAAREHRLTFQVDTATGGPIFFPRRSTVDSVQTRDSAGTGTIYSFTVIRQHGQPYFKSRVPYVVGFVDLDEGFRMLAEIAGDPQTVQIGQRVAVDWEDHEDVSVPIFRVVSTEES
jgi:uncharacterized OB-fold protein